jgi:sugar lactone lactonase YvrE
MAVSTQGNSAIEVIANDHNLTGESPLWSVNEGALYWLDTRIPRIYRVHIASGKRSDWGCPSKVNAIGLMRGGLVCSTKDGIYYLNTSTGAYEKGFDPEANDPHSRANDGKVDRAGRFWFTSMEDDGKTPTGKLYRLDADRTVVTLDAGYSVPNGLGWSPDEKLMYLGDTRAATIYVFDFERASGSVRNKRPYVQTAASDGMPDGLCVDSNGYVWSARVGAGAVARFAPDGKLDRRIELPVSRPTSVMLGGDDLRTLFISTASRALTDDQLKAQPLAGAMLAVRVDVPGLPELDYAG